MRINRALLLRISVSRLALPERLPGALRIAVLPPLKPTPKSVTYTNSFRGTIFILEGAVLWCHEIVDVQGSACHPWLAISLLVVHLHRPCSLICPDLQIQDVDLQPGSNRTRPTWSTKPLS